MEIRGDETALRLLGIEYALHPLALEDALRPSQRPKEERYETHTQIVVPRFVVHGADETPRVATENVSIFVSGESLVTYAASTKAPAWSRPVWTSHFRRPTSSTRYCPRNCVCLMAYFHTGRDGSGPN